MTLVDRRCDPCAKFGGKAQHGLCTDPAGRAQLCGCFLTNDNHRYQHGQLAPDSWGEEPDWDGGLGSRATVDRWEREQEAHEEAIR